MPGKQPQSQKGRSPEMANKKGHRKPIRRLAMTSILKQNTLGCLALPLHSYVSTAAHGRLNRDLYAIRAFARFFGELHEALAIVTAARPRAPAALPRRSAHRRQNTVVRNLPDALKPIRGKRFRQFGRQGGAVLTATAGRRVLARATVRPAVTLGSDAVFEAMLTPSRTARDVIRP